MLLRFVAAMACLLIAAAQAQEVEPDSMLSYELGEVFVESGEERNEMAIQKIPLATWRRSDAVSVAEAGRLFSAAHIRTNSRGETLITLRGSSDRQVPVYLDGVPLTMPWDQRVDLSLLPAGVVGSATVAKGAAASRIAANGYGGAINLVSRERRTDGRTVESGAQVGTGNQLQAGLTWLERRGKWSTQLAVSRFSRDGAPLPDDIELPFSQMDEALRTNTDYNSLNLFVRGAYEPGSQSRIGVTYISVNGEKGVAPESHLDPNLTGVRFWRYPEWTFDALQIAGRAPVLGVNLQSSVWAGWASQQILQYPDSSYQQSNGREDSEDNNFGARITARKDFRLGAVRAIGSLSHARHSQSLYDNDGEALTISAEPSFSETRGTVGFETNLDISPAMEVLVSAGTDALWAHEAGPNPVPDEIWQSFGTVSIHRELQENLSVRASFGRRARLPSMRERYDDALGRFETNPDLAPEKAWLLDMGARAEGDFSHLEATVFSRWERGTIQTEQDAMGTRRRVNLGGSNVYGVEFSGAARPFQELSLQGHATFFRQRGFTVEEEGLRIAETPEILGWLSAEARPVESFTASAEAVYTGVAYSRVDDDLARLEPSLVLNVRVGYHVVLPLPAYSVEVFGRVNNLTDTVVLPQIGLPGAGRVWLFGLSAHLG